MTTWPGMSRVVSMTAMTAFLPTNSYLASAKPAREEKKSWTTTVAPVT